MNQVSKDYFLMSPSFLNSYCLFSHDLLLLYSPTNSGLFFFYASHIEHWVVYLLSYYSLSNALHTHSVQLLFYTVVHSLIVIIAYNNNLCTNILINQTNHLLLFIHCTTLLILPWYDEECHQQNTWRHNINKEVEEQVLDVIAMTMKMNKRNYLYHNKWIILLNKPGFFVIQVTIIIEHSIPPFLYLIKW